MATEQELIQRIQRGQRFQGLLSDTTFKELVDELGSNAFHAWNIAKVEDSETQKIAKLDLEASKRIFAYCKSHVIDGNNAMKALEKLQKK